MGKRDRRVNVESVACEVRPVRRERPVNGDRAVPLVCREQTVLLDRKDRLAIVDRRVDPVFRVRRVMLGHRERRAFRDCVV